MKQLFTVLIIASCLGMNAQDTPIQSLQLVEKAHLVYEGHKVHFEKVISDSRCPKDVTCVMAGWAMVKLTVTAAGDKNAHSFDLKIPAAIVGQVLPVVFKNKEGQLLVQKLTPYPILSEAFDTREYCLNLIWLPNQ
jgi:hypothetical protein